MSLFRCPDPGSASRLSRGRRLTSARELSLANLPVRMAVLLAAPMLCAGVPWVDNQSIPSFDGRQDLTREQIADQQFRKGREYFEQARELEAKAVDASPTRRARLLDRALSRYRASADAFAASLRKLQAEPRSIDYLPQLHLEMGDALYKTGRHPEAIRAYEQAVVVAPAYLHAHFGLARACLAAGELDCVREGYERLLREAETRGAAWARVDALVALTESWQSHRAQRANSDDAVQGFDIWFAEAREDLAETVRWTALDSGDPNAED